MNEQRKEAIRDALLLMTARERDAIRDAIAFLDRIEGHGYGGEAEFECARRGLQCMLKKIPMTEITPEDLRWKAESVTDPMVARMLNEAADCIDSLRSENAVLRDRAAGAE